jgi:sec-independent protein translocase protein TatA
MSFGPTEILLILALVLVFFGPKRLPQLGKSIGEAIKGFKTGLNSDDARDVTEASKLKEPEKEKEKV